MKLRFSPAVFATLGVPLKTATAAQNPIIFHAKENEFSHKHVKDVLIQYKDQLAELKLGEGLDIDVYWKDKLNFSINLSVNVQGVVMGVMHNSNFCRRFVYTDSIDHSKQWENYFIHSFTMPLDKDELSDLFIPKSGLININDLPVALPPQQNYEVSYGAKLPSVTVKNGKIQEETVNVADGTYILKRAN